MKVFTCFQACSEVYLIFEGDGCYRKTVKHSRRTRSVLCRLRTEHCRVRRGRMVSVLLLLLSGEGSTLSYTPSPEVGLCEKTAVKIPGGSNAVMTWWPEKVLATGAAKALRKPHAEGMARRLRRSQNSWRTRATQGIGRPCCLLEWNGEDLHGSEQRRDDDHGPHAKQDKGRNNKASWGATATVMCQNAVSPGQRGSSGDVCMCNQMYFLMPGVDRGKENDSS